MIILIESKSVSSFNLLSCTCTVGQYYPFIWISLFVDISTASQNFSLSRRVNHGQIKQVS